MFELLILIIAAQLIDSYIRWLAFSEKFKAEIKLQLFKSYFLWSLASFFVYYVTFSMFGISATTYKAILMLGWLPYFIIGVKFIKIGLNQHVFVLGMGVICSLVQHTICAMIILNSFEFRSDARIILTEAAGYLLLFAVSLPTFGRCFVKLLPSREFFDLRPIGFYIAILPLVIVSGHLIRLADGILVHSSMERLSRIYLPVVFFFFYRYILTAAKNFYDMQKNKRNRERMEEQLSDLKAYNERIMANQKKISVMRHDLRHNYNLIYALLEEGNTEKALEHIKKQEKIIRGGGGGVIMVTAFEITLIQMTSAYLRYLPFSDEMTEKERSDLIKAVIIWSAAGFAINFWIFGGGVNYQTFKMSLATGWLPYFIISVLIIRKKFPQHVFILGMQLLWSFMLHSLSGMAVALIYGAMSEARLSLQATIYLALFAILFGVERKYFKNLLPTVKFFEDKALRWCVSILPLAIFIGTTLPIVEVTFLPTWREKFSRIFLPIFFLLIYRSMSIMTQYMAKKQEEEQQIRLITRQIESLQENNLLIEQNQHVVNEMQEKLLGNYKTIEELVTAGEINAAKALIIRENEQIESTRMKIYCAEPLINAALSINKRRAEVARIKIEFKIDLAEKIVTDESDLAVLLSNLLENAITASKKQNPPLRREISLILRHKGGKNILEISNWYENEVQLGESGLPYTTEIGHGLGMSSLELFAKKYDAFVDFSQENGLVRLMMYWNDYLEAK